MAQVRSRQRLRANRARFIGLCTLAIGLLAGPAPTAHAQARLAAVAGAFDDWSPSEGKETLPCARPAPGTGGRLGYSTILGSWCAPKSRYNIERRKFIVLLKNGQRVVFPITRFIFKTATVEIRWTSKGESKRTVFGRFSANQCRMVQFGVNRTYNRC